MPIPQGPVAPPGGPAQGPPGEDTDYASVVDNGGTNLDEESILLMAASIAWKQQMQEDLEPHEQAFIERFFPGGIPPEIAQFSAEAAEQQESAEQETAMQPEGPQPGMPPQQPAGPGVQ